MLSRLNKQTVDLSKELATAERQLVGGLSVVVSDAAGLTVDVLDVPRQNALYLPFQAAIYEMQNSASERRKTQEVPQRTEL